MHKLLLISLILLPFSNGYAAMYKWLDENGEVVYSDEPPHENAEELVPPGLTTTPAVKYKPKPKPKTNSSKPSSNHYKLLSISSPSNDETIRNNAGNFSVQISISPALNIKKGHSIALLLDGTVKVSQSKTGPIQLKHIDRGTHSLTAQILDKNGKLLKTSKPVTIHLHRFSKLH